MHILHGYDDGKLGTRMKGQMYCSENLMVGSVFCIIRISFTSLFFPNLILLILVLEHKNLPHLNLT